MKQIGLNEVAILIPVLNEERAIGYVLDEVLSTGIPSRNVIVVDGGSTDNTVNIAVSRGVLVVQQEGRGKAKAIKTGLKYVTTPYVLVMDGDGTYPAGFIVHLLSRAVRDNCDLVIGVRAYGRGSQKFIFKLGNAALTRFFNILYGVKLRDILSGMYLAKTEKLKEVDFETYGFSVESEIVAHFVSLGRTVCEENIEYRPRIDPRAKKLRVHHGFKIALDIVRLTWRYMPVFLIFALGTLLLIPGLALGIWVMYRYITLGVLHHVKGLAAIVLTGVGLQCLVATLITLYVKRIELRLHRKLDRIVEALYNREAQTLQCAVH